MHRTLREAQATPPTSAIANRDEACKGEGITMTVAPDGRATPSPVPSTNHRQTYKTR